MSRMTSRRSIWYVRQPLETRVRDLLSRMTLDEKLAQIGCVWSSSLIQDGEFPQHGPATSSGRGSAT